METCPQCGGYQTSKINPPQGSSDYFLVSIDRNSSSVNPTSGMPLQAYGCLNCKGVWFKNSDLRQS